MGKNPVGVVGGVAIAVLLVAALAGCGSSSTASGVSSADQKYLVDARDALYEASSTASTLPDAVSGMSGKQDATWKAAAAKLQAASSRLGQEAARLAALTPPAGLRTAQEIAVSSIRKAQAGVDKLAARLLKRSGGTATTQTSVQSAVTGLQSQIDRLAKTFRAALSGAGGSPAPTP